MKLNEELLQQASEMKKEGVRIKTIMNELNIEGYSYHGFRSALYRYECSLQKGVIYEDSKVQEKNFESIEDYYNKLKSIDHALKELDTKQTKTSIRIQDDKPICLSFWGDWHLGSRGVDYDRFDRDMEIIKNTEGLFFIGMGDYIDNNSAYVTRSTNENMIPQEMQRELAMAMMKEVSNKCLALVEGCHEHFSYKVDGFNFVTNLCLEVNAVNLWHGGTVKIKLGDQEYKIYARHRYKNESSLNTTNAHRNILNNIGPCDIAALGHLHYPDMQMLDRMGQKVIYFRSGSYKVYDDYGQKIGGYSAIPGIPSAILFPNSHKLVPFQNVEDAVTYLQAIRK